MRVALGVVLLLAAYAMLVPGLTLPMLNLSGTVEKAQLVDIGREILRDSESTSGLVRGLAERFLAGLDTSGTVQAFDKSNSILGTAGELWRSGNALVAILIVSFSVVVPAFKALLMLGTLAPLRPALKAPLQGIAAASGKWSMADVFVIAIFIAFLAGAGMSESRGLVAFEARLDDGFWWFLAYCLTSILATQLIGAGRAPLPGTDARAALPALPGPAGSAPRARAKVVAAARAPSRTPRRTGTATRGTKPSSASVSGGSKGAKKVASKRVVRKKAAARSTR